jgi:Tectonin domain/Ricin-type beta-trefoil lectin domain-like
VRIEPMTSARVASLLNDVGDATTGATMTSTDLEPAGPVLGAGAAPSRLVSISATADGAVYAADASGALHCRGVGPASWEPVAGSLTAIAAAADGTVLGLASTDGHVVEFVSGQWQPFSPQPSTRLRRLAVGSANGVWGVDEAGGVLTVAGSTWVTSTGLSEVREVSAASDGSVWALHGQGIVSAYREGAWTPLSSAGGMTSIAGAQAGWLWSIDGSGAVLQWDGARGFLPVASSPRVMRAVACADDGTVWLRDDDGDLWAYDVERDAWQALPAPSTKGIAAFTVGSATQGWAVDTEDAPFSLDTDATWRVVEGAAEITCVAAGNATDVWAVTSGGRVLRSQGRTWHPVDVGGGKVQVSAAADGTVLAVDGYGAVFDYADGAWRSMPGTQQRVAAGSATLVFATDGHGRIARFDAGGWSPFPSSDLDVKDLAVSADGMLWAVDGKGRLHVYTGGKPPWYPTAGPRLERVAAGSSANVWGIDAAGDPVSLVDLAGLSEGGAGGPARVRRPGWDGVNPFDEADSTHLWIVNRAASLAGELGGGEGVAVENLVKPFMGKIGDPFHDNLCQGLYDADFKAPYDDPNGIGGARLWTSHFFDPDSGLNYQGKTDPTALTRGRSFANEALEHYRGDDLPAAGYALGLALHYLTDLTQPMHAANKTLFDSDPMGWHSAFEARVMQEQAAVSAPTTFQVDPSNDLDAYFLTAAKTAKAQLRKVWPPLVERGYFGYRERMWNEQVAPNVAGILQGAIAVTAQFLVAWMRLANVETDAPVVIVNATSGLVLESRGVDKQIVQNPLSGSALQRWALGASPFVEIGGYYEILQLARAGTVLSVYAMRSDTPVLTTWGIGRLLLDQWQLKETAGGAFQLENANSHLCVTPSDTFKAGAGMRQQREDPALAQSFILAPTQPVTLGCGQLVLDIPHGTTTPLTPIQLHAPNGRLLQQWQFVPVLLELGGDVVEVFVILSLQNGLALEAATVKGELRLVQNKWSWGAAQRWKRVELADGTNILTSVAAGDDLVLTAAEDKQGSAIGLQADTGSALQRWTLGPVVAGRQAAPDPAPGRA